MCVYFPCARFSHFFLVFIFRPNFFETVFCVQCVSLFITSSVYSKQRKRLSTPVLVLNELNIDHVVRKMSKTMNKKKVSFSAMKLKRTNKNFLLVGCSTGEWIFCDIKRIRKKQTNKQTELQLFRSYAYRRHE